jgi:hypothetical protein
LDSVRHSAHRFADSAVFGNVIKELEVMNVHTSDAVMLLIVGLGAWCAVA